MQISGRVVNALGVPIQSAKVEAVPRNDSAAVASTETGADGNFSFPYYPEESGDILQIRVLKNGFVTSSVQHDVKTGATIPSPIVLNQEGVEISGRITDAIGAP